VNANTFFLHYDTKLWWSKNRKYIITHEKTYPREYDMTVIRKELKRDKNLFFVQAVNQEFLLFKI
jgi:hypothetical protein